MTEVTKKKDNLVISFLMIVIVVLKTMPYTQIWSRASIVHLIVNRSAYKTEAKLMV